MSNEIAEHTIKSRYVIEVPRFIPRFAIFALKRELYASALCSFKNWATTKLLTNKFRRFVGLFEGRMSPAVSAQG